MPNEDYVRLPRFDGRNFGLWKRQVTIVLKSKKLLDCIIPDDGKTVSDARDNQAQAILFSAMEQSVIQKVITCNTAYEVWERLLAVYENTSPASVGKVLRDYYSYEKDPTDDMATHISKVESLAIQLEEVGEPQTEVSVMAKLLHSLPDSYDYFKEAWNSVHPTLQTKTTLVSRLLSQDRPEKADEVKNAALLLRDRPQPKGGRKKVSNKGRMKKVQCYGCKEYGHYRRDCKNKKESSPPATVSNVMSYALSVKDGSEKNDFWIVDSGASRHICCRKEWFSSLSCHSERLQVANQQLVEAIAVGTVIMRAKVGNTSSLLTLDEVLYVPEMTQNLLSSVVAYKKGVFTTMVKEGYQLNCRGKIIGMCPYSESIGLFVLDAKVVFNSAMIITTKRSLSDWHATLGHADPSMVKKMAASGSVEGLELVNGGENPKCSTCPAGKATRAPHPESSRPKPNQVGDIVDGDLFGPMTKISISKKKYALLLKDRFSSYTHAYSLKTKDETHLALQNFFGTFERESGQRVKVLQVDNGSEFSGAKVKLLCDVEQVGIEFSAPYTPEQNGHAERNNRTMIETARTMLVDSGQDRELWDEALAAAVYVRNRVLRKDRDVTPFEAYFKRRPFVGHLVPFGTEVHSLINDRRVLGKFDSKTEAAIIVGFSERRNTYRLYIPGTKKVKWSCDVIFRGHSNRKSNNAEHPEPKDTPVSLGPSDCSDQMEVAQVRPGNELDAPHNDYEQIEDFGPIDLGDQEEIDSPSFSTLSAGEGAEMNVGLGGEDESRNSWRIIPGLYSCMGTVSSQEPRNFGEAISGPNREEWKKAIRDELLAHQANNTWSIVPRPSCGLTLTAKWVFKLKRDADGTIERFKARLVARGFQQREGIDFHETFAPVARSESIRVLFAIAAMKDLHLERFDVSTAFLNGKVDQELLIEPPEGVETKPGECLRLNKALYGLKQAPMIWNSCFDTAIRKIGFKPLKADPCVYLDEERNRILAVYVDDGIVIGPSKNSCVQLIQSLNNSFVTKRIEGDVFLGLQILRDNNGIHLNQKRYIGDMLSRYQMMDCSPVTVPMVDAKSLVKDDQSEKVDAPYRAAVGSLLYAALATRPDILYPTILLSRFNNAPKQRHWVAVKRILRYLKGTDDVGLSFKAEKGKVSVEAYSDADWAGAAADSHSTTGVIVFLCGSPVIFVSRLQETVALSSTEAEFIAAYEAAKEISWLSTLLRELKIDFEKPSLFLDNKSTIHLIKNRDVKRRTKHIKIKFHYVREEYLSGSFDLEHVGTKEQRADFLTKQLPGPQLDKLLRLCNVSKCHRDPQDS